MPTYQYACTECGHAFDQVQSFSEASLTVCPVCQGRLRKIYNAVGVVFKGSGFYATDSRASSAASDPAGSSDSKSEGKAEGKAETKSDTKSESKGESKSPAKSESTSSTSSPSSSSTPAGS